MNNSINTLRFFLDASVPRQIGTVIESKGYQVIYHNDALMPGTPDEVVCAAAVANSAVLIAIDQDMKRIAKQYGITPNGGDRFKSLNIIRLCCNEVLAIKRFDQAFSLILHEWNFCSEKQSRRLWFDVGPHFMRTHR